MKVADPVQQNSFEQIDWYDRGFLVASVLLDQNALDYVASALADADGLASAIQREALSEPVVFVPKDTNPAKLQELNAGGITTQASADAELSTYIAGLKRNNFRLCSVVLHDPWSNAGDQDYAGPSPNEMITVCGRIYYLHDIADKSSILFREYRARSVSFMKIVYVFESSTQSIRTMIGAEPNDSFRTLAPFVRHIFTNVYDDESWIGVRHNFR